MRKKPSNADFYRWDQFNEWADLNGIGTHADDWTPWWDCWRRAYSIAMQG